MEMQVASALALWAAQPLCRFVHDTKVCFTQCQSFFCSFVAIPIQGWRRWEQDVAHQSCNGGGNEVNEHGGAASGDFFLSHIAVNVCRVLISRHASTAGKAPAFTASKAKIDRGCKATKKTAKTSACWRGEEEAKKGGKLLLLHLQGCVPYLIHSNFSSVIKQVHPDTGISNKVMAILKSLMNDIFKHKVLISRRKVKRIRYLSLLSHSVFMLIISINSGLHITGSNQVSSNIVWALSLFWFPHLWHCNGLCMKVFSHSSKFVIVQSNTNH